jgi:hypothetical protein
MKEILENSYIPWVNRGVRFMFTVVSNNFQGFSLLFLLVPGDSTFAAYNEVKG